MPLSIAPQASLLRVSTLVPQTARIGVASATLGGVAVGLKDSVREARGERRRNRRRGGDSGIGG